MEILNDFRITVTEIASVNEEKVLEKFRFRIILEPFLFLFSIHTPIATLF